MSHPRVAHVITGLGTGGAEMMLLKLLAASEALRAGATVVSLADAGTVGPRIAALGVPVVPIGARGAGALGAVGRVRRALAAARPDVVQGWMYHGNLAALLAPRGVPVLWNVRQSIGRLRREKPTTAAVILAGGALSGRARVIVYNSGVSAREHEALGYRRDRTRVLPNGFDLERFRPMPEARARIRAALGVPEDACVVGSLGRFHPMKDHANFLAALGRLLPEMPALHAVMGGAGVEPANPALAGRVPPGHAARVHLLGEVREIPEFMAALDVFCLSSGHGEGFPNVVGEAMACGVPCVVTDSGDAPDVVGDAGTVVPMRDPPALASALRAALLLPPAERAALGARARARVSAKFSIAAVAATYEALYREASGWRSS